MNAKDKRDLKFIGGLAAVVAVYCVPLVAAYVVGGTVVAVGAAIYFVRNVQ